MKSVILGAGFGSRLGKPMPKPLTVLSSGEMIMERQVASLIEFMTIHDLIVVVGFKKNMIMEEFPELTYVFNNIFDRTNTAKSLVRGLRKINNEDVIWLNGDVVFDPEVVKRVFDFDGSCMAVNTASVADEEIKYNLHADGSIKDVSKTVADPLGEAVGVNKIMASDLPLFIEMLDKCGANDYFERGIELAVENGLKIYPVDISDLLCIEVDFEEDLEKANTRLDDE